MALMCWRTRAKCLSGSLHPLRISAPMICGAQQNTDKKLKYVFFGLALPTYKTLVLLVHLKSDMMSSVTPFDMSLSRRMDMVMYVLYSMDECFVYDMVGKVVSEILNKYDCLLLAGLMAYKDRPVLFRCMFFLLLNFSDSFRFWILGPSASLDNGLPPLCEFKMCRFLQHLRNELIPNFLVQESITMDEFDRNIKVAYIAS